MAAVLRSIHPSATIALVLHLRQLRATHAVARALWERWPREADWLATCNDPEFLATIDEFAQCIQDIRDTVTVGPLLTPEAVQTAVTQHWHRGLEAVDDFATLLGVDGVEILSVLVRGLRDAALDDPSPGGAGTDPHGPGHPGH